MKKISLFALFLTAGLSSQVIGAAAPNFSQKTPSLIICDDPAPAPAPAPTPDPTPAPVPMPAPSAPTS